MGGNNKQTKKIGGKGGASHSARNSTGTLRGDGAAAEAAAAAAAEAELMEQGEDDDEDDGQAVGSAAQAAQARARTTQLVTQEKERSEELARRLKALEEENAALKKVMRCSLLVWGISYFLHTICMTASR